MLRRPVEFTVGDHHHIHHSHITLTPPGRHAPEQVAAITRNPRPASAEYADDLLGRKSGAAGKRGPTPKLQQKIEQLSRLPKAKQKFVIQMLESVIGQAGR